MKVFEARQIKFSKRLIEQKNTFLIKWVTVKEFLFNLFEYNQLNNSILVEQIIQQLCMRNHQKQISNQLSITLYTIFNKYLKQVDKNNLIPNIVLFYAKLTQKIQLISQLFQYFEAHYLINKQQKTIKKMAFNIFHNEISNQHVIQQEIIEYILQTVQEYRSQKSQLSEQKICLLRMVVEIGMFKKSIEGQFIERSKHYYQDKRGRLPNNIYFLNFIDNEICKQGIIKSYLNSQQDIIKIIEKQLIIQNIDLMIDYFEYLLNEQKIKQLQLLWKFFNQVDKLQLLLKKLQQLIAHSEKNISNIQKLIIFKNKIIQIAQLCFHSNKQIITFVENAFENLFSKHSTLCNKIMTDYFIQTYSDFYMLDQYKQLLPFQMFKSNPSKDLLIVQYQNKLAQYILTNNQINLSKHVAMIAKIKQFCGGSLTRNIQLMIKDVWNNGNLLIQKYNKFHCKLLSKNYWPKLQEKKLNLPDQLRYLRDQFQQYYLSKTFNKKLNWIYSLGQFEIFINDVLYVFSQIQAAIVIYLSKSIRPMKKQQIISVLQIDSSQVLTHLQQLKRNGLVIQHVFSNSLELNLQDLKQYKYVKRLNIQKSKQIQVSNDRSLATDACLMRLLKFKKVMSKPQLLKQFPKTVKIFKPTIEQINNSLQRLRQKQFIDINGLEIKYIP